MKKLLALVLALVMTLSLCVTSNAAYKDAADVDLNEAVDVLTAVGVFQGDENGKMNPKANLTREQAAKLVAYLQIGQKAADALVGGSKFTDVAKTAWSAGYVDYCASTGVVAGVGAGKFDPAGSLTALQFGKMLLVCLGYDAKAEGLTGSDWTINTSKLMTSANLLKGLDAVTANSVVTREQAAQMMLNALKAPMVEYANKATSISVNGAVIDFGGSTASYVTSTIAKEQTISKEHLSNDGPFTVELGEKLFPKLVLTATTDDFGRPANKWTNNGKKIGVYAKAADYTYTTGVKEKDLYSDLGLSSDLKATTEWYIDGKLQDTAKTFSKTSTTKFGANGLLTEFWVDTEANTLKCVQVNTYVAKVASVVKATSTADRYVTLDDLYVTSIAKLNPKFETESFDTKDLVTFTMAWNDSTSKYDIQTVTALEKTATADLTKYVGSNINTAGSNFTAGETYNYSKNFHVDGATADTDSVSLFKLETSLDVYCDQYGYAIYVEGTETATDYAVVLAIGSTNPYGTGTQGATLLLADGTVKEATIKWSTTTNAGRGAYDDIDGVRFLGDLVTYTVKNDVYTLTAADARAVGTSTSKYSNNATDDNGSVHFNTATITNGKSHVTLGGNSLYATEQTLFFVKTGALADHSKWTYNVYTGYNAVPQITEQGADNIKAVTYVTDATVASQVKAVFVDCVAVDGYTGNTTIIARQASPDVITEAADYSYAVLPAIVDGEITTVAVNYKDMLAATKTMNGAGSYYFSSVVTNDKDQVSSGTQISTTAQSNSLTSSDYGYATQGTVAANTTKKVVGFKNAGSVIYWAYNDSTKVYYISDDWKEITEGDVTAIGTDETDTVLFTLTSDKVLKNVYIQKVAETVTDAVTPVVSLNETYAFAQGTTETLTVTNTAAGTADLSYKWYKNGALVAGDNATLTIDVSAAGTATYKCVVTNTDNTKSGEKEATATTNTATVTVYAPMTVVVKYVKESGVVVKTLAPETVAYDGTTNQSKTYTFDASLVPGYVQIGFDNTQTIAFEAGAAKTVTFYVEETTLSTDASLASIARGGYNVDISSGTAFTANSTGVSAPLVVTATDANATVTITCTYDNGTTGDYYNDSWGPATHECSTGTDNVSNLRNKAFTIRVTAPAGNYVDYTLTGDQVVS